jgi:hypothetical protein
MKAKYIFLYMFLTVFLISFNGCYTIAWTPDQEIPDDVADNAESEYYYPQAYYGNYSAFYGGSWWSHSGVISESIKSAKEQKHIRNQNANRAADQTNFTTTRPVGSSSTAPTVGTSTGSGSSSSGAAKSQQSDSTQRAQSSGNDTKDVRNSNNNRSPNDDNNSSSSTNADSRGSVQGSGSDRGRK